MDNAGSLFGGSSTRNTRSIISRIIGVLAIVIFVLGAISGIYLGMTIVTQHEGFNFSIMLTAWFSSFLLGMILEGIKEVINICEDQNEKLYAIREKLDKLSQIK